jgi:DNA-binding phage protein
MNDAAPSSPYDTADYLQTPEDLAAYLNAVLEEGDERVLLAALEDATRAARRIMPGQIEVQGQPGLADLVELLHLLGFEFSLRPKRAA